MLEGDVVVLFQTGCAMVVTTGYPTTAHRINYVHNRIREHEQGDLVHDWLVVRGFRGPTDGDLRKRVGPPMGTATAARRR